MPKTEIDYSTTIIYKITCKDENIKDLYVGHTTNFIQRKHAHKQNAINTKSSNHKCKLYEVIRANGGWTNWTMEIINFFNCKDHYEARKKEQEYFILLNANLNSIEPLPKPKEVKPVIKKNEDAISLFTCDTCHFTTCKESNYNIHLLTRKHKHMMNPIEEKISVEHKCKCGKKYKHLSTLCAHRKNCTKPLEQLSIIDNNNIDNIDNNKLITFLINEISEFKNILSELVKSNSELQKYIIEKNI